MSTAALQEAKQRVRAMVQAVDADPDALTNHVAPTYRWRGVHPFYELSGADAVQQNFLGPLHASLTACHRREDIFFAGYNQHADHEIWTCSRGSFMGLFDRDFVGIPAHGKTVCLPYAEFNKFDPATGKIEETAVFLDLIALQQQVGLDPVPTQTGSKILHPAPLTLDGVQMWPADKAATQATRELLDTMIDDLSQQNRKGPVACPPDLLRKTWHEDMAWYGPGGIGTSITIPRYQEQHQTPFRTRLSDNRFNGHVCRIAEGTYSGWFGWPNLNNRNTGGFLGLAPSDLHAEMRVVDIYRRDGDKLAENWVYIDLLYYALQHGVDLLNDPDALSESPRAPGAL